ncbi:hypothetical protein Bca52824_095134 [Brassica carinata]|nr:hypothetical protein Bca52824_095134 [Brassica carinata]
MEAKGSFCRAKSFRSRKRFEKSREVLGSKDYCQIKDIQGMIFVLFKTKSKMITNEFGEILHRYIYMGFRKALKFHQFYFGDEFQNLELEEIKEEDAEGKEVNVGVAEKKKGAHTVLFKQSVAAGIGSLKPQNKTDEISNTAFKA